VGKVTVQILRQQQQQQSALLLSNLVANSALTHMHVLKFTLISDVQSA
jgi:hypothetical protein